MFGTCSASLARPRSARPCRALPTTCGALLACAPKAALGSRGPRVERACRRSDWPHTSRRCRPTSVRHLHPVAPFITLADAGDTLTEAIAVRGLSLRHCPLRAPIQNEVATRGPIGLSLAVPALFGVWAMVSDLRIAFGVSVSLLVASMIASAIGVLLPWSPARLRLDPALSSARWRPIIQGVVTILL